MRSGVVPIFFEKNEKANPDPRVAGMGRGRLSRAAVAMLVIATASALLAFSAWSRVGRRSGKTEPGAMGGPVVEAASAALGAELNVPDEPDLSHVPERWRSVCEAAINRKKPLAFHQTRGDYYIYHTFFRDRAARRRGSPGAPRGVYLEVGAYHPTKLSASAFFDICLGWHGVCVEPDPTKQSQWVKSDRTCGLARRCVTDHETKACMKDLNDGVTRISTVGKEACAEGEAVVSCAPLEEILETTRAKSRFGAPVPLGAGSRNRVQIDVASVDIEHHEIQALRCFPFDRYNVSVFLIETRGQEKRIDWFMLNKGYVKWDNLRNYRYDTDSLYVRRDFIYPAVAQSGVDTRDRWTAGEKERKLMACPNPYAKQQALKRTRRAKGESVASDDQPVESPWLQR